MLLRLEIKNYILIENLSIDFDEGLNVFTGETGAGKSIIADAVEFLSAGGRMTPAVIRSGAERCSLAGIFDISCNKIATEILKSAGYDISQNEVIIRREIDISGRSRCYINDKPVSISFLKNFAARLVDIHGQHEHQSLLDNNFQREFLDIYGSSEKHLNEYKNCYEVVRNLEARLQAIEVDITEKDKLIDLLEYQIKEIDSLGKISSDEEERIRESLPQMKNATRLKEVASEISRLMDGDATERGGKSLPSILDNLENLANKAATLIGEGRNPDVENALKEIALLRPHLENLCTSLAEFVSASAAFDEKKADELIGKLDKIERLKKKYNASTVEELIKFRQDASTRLEDLKKSDDVKTDILNELSSYRKKLSAFGVKLTESRRKSASTLTKSVLSELKQLALPNASFEVRLIPLPSPGPYGTEEVEFYFNANPGEKSLPLKEVVSGGEMSRVMLALKTALALSSSVAPVMIFDEIDSGLSGPTGQVVGEKFSALSKTSQIIAITHLAQIAAFATKHFLVRKTTRGSRTFTDIKILEGDERLNELARMLSGKGITETALNHARQLLDEAGGKRIPRRTKP